jgi:hypothetical protein
MHAMCESRTVLRIPRAPAKTAGFEEASCRCPLPAMLSKFCPDCKLQTDDHTSSHGTDTVEPAMSLEEACPSATSSTNLGYLDARYASFVRTQDNARSVNRTFWNQLDESAGCAKSASVANSRDQLDAGSALFTQPEFPLNFVFGNAMEDKKTDLSGISEKERAFLVPVFFARVHPICRILHEPTALAFIQDIDQMTDARTRKLKYDSLWAIDCAMAFSASKTLTFEECESELGMSKHDLETRLCCMLESTLSACDIVNSKELVTLQAFTLYIVSDFEEQQYLEALF